MWSAAVVYLMSIGAKYTLMLYLDPWALVNHHHPPLLRFRSHMSLGYFLYHYVVLMSHVCVSYSPWGLLKLTEIYLLPSEAIHQSFIL